MVDVVIIGAGLTGLSAAYHLEKNQFTNYVILEKDSTFGGLCRTVVQDGFTFDYTGHLLHINDPYFRSFIESVVGLEQFNTINRRSFVYSQNIFTPYPYQINLKGLPTQTIVDCIKGYVERCSRKNPRTFEQWVLAHFGIGFAKYFFFPYQEKIFDFPVKKLSASWTGRFVPQTSLEQIIGGTLEYDEQASVGYNAQFFYPKQDGIFFWIHKLAQELKKPIELSRQITLIKPREKRLILNDGSDIRYNKLISTMPLDILLGCIQDPSSLDFKKALKYLKCNKVINFNIGINRPDLSDKHWVYYPEHEYPFYRLGFPHNFATSMAPHGCSSLYGEISYLHRTSEYVNNLLQSALHATKQLWNIKPSDIMTEKIIPIEHAYVIFDRWRDKNLSALLGQLEEFDIYSVGRYGAWKYASMQEGLLDGKAIAEKIVALSSPHFFTKESVNETYPS